MTEKFSKNSVTSKLLRCSVHSIKKETNRSKITFSTGSVLSTVLYISTNVVTHVIGTLRPPCTSFIKLVLPAHGRVRAHLLHSVCRSERLKVAFSVLNVSKSIIIFG